MHLENNHVKVNGPFDRDGKLNVHLIYDSGLASASIYFSTLFKLQFFLLNFFETAENPIFFKPFYFELRNSILSLRSQKCPTLNTLSKYLRFCCHGFNYQGSTVNARFIKRIELIEWKGQLPITRGKTWYV